MTEQTCECPSGNHGHKAGECDKPATREDKRCDPCREAEEKEAMQAVETPGDQPGQAGGMFTDVKSGWHVR